jgi:hypothetical protein
MFFTFAPLRPFDVAQDMLCARQSEMRTVLSRQVLFFAVKIFHSYGV